MGNEKDTGVKRESLFNEAAAKIQRLHDIRVTIHEARMNNNWIQYMNSVECLRIELNERFTDDEETYANNEAAKINKIVSDWKSYQSTWQHSSLEYKDYLILINYEMWLLKRARKQGLSMPDAPNMTDSLM